MALERAVLSIEELEAWTPNSLKSAPDAQDIRTQLAAADAEADVCPISLPRRNVKKKQ